MRKITTLHYLIYLTNLFLVYGYTPLPVKITDPRIKTIPNLVSSSSFVYNDVTYLYGGFYNNYADQSYSTTMYRYEFIEDSATFELSVVNSTNSGPKCDRCAAHPIPNTTKVYLLGYKEPLKADNVSLPLFQPYVFDFNTLTWTNLTDTVTYNGGARGNKAFEFRKSYSSVLVKNSQIYIIGGITAGGNTTTSGFCTKSVIYYDVNTNIFNVLDKDAPECRMHANSFITERYRSIYAENY